MHRDLSAESALGNLEDQVSAVDFSVVSRSLKPGAHCSPEQFRSELVDLGVEPEFAGWYRDDPTADRVGVVAFCRGVHPPAIRPAPPDFRVVAVIPTYNEEDVIAPTIRHLSSHGVGVYLIDNWSTDSTVDRALAATTDLVGHERFPADGPSMTFRLADLLERIEALAPALDADWIVLNDADELRDPPWVGVTLRDALYHVQESGFTAVNHTCLNFALTQDTHRDGDDPADHLRWFVPSVFELRQLTTWRRLPDVQAEIAWSGRHQVRFPGISVFPYNFLLRHFPLRSSDQARRKVFGDRLPRFDRGERLQGWHTHYDRLSPSSDLLVSTTGMLRFSSDFDVEYVVERLTGVGFESRPSVSQTKLKLARLLKRAGVLDQILRLRWRWRLARRARR